MPDELKPLYSLITLVLSGVALLNVLVPFRFMGIQSRTKAFVASLILFGVTFPLHDWETTRGREKLANQPGGTEKLTAYDAGQAKLKEQESAKRAEQAKIDTDIARITAVMLEPYVDWMLPKFESEVGTGLQMTSAELRSELRPIYGEVLGCGLREVSKLLGNEAIHDFAQQLTTNGIPAKPSGAPAHVRAVISIPGMNKEIAEQLEVAGKLCDAHMADQLDSLVTRRVAVVTAKNVAKGVTDTVADEAKRAANDALDRAKQKAMSAIFN